MYCSGFLADCVLLFGVIPCWPGLMYGLPILFELFLLPILLAANPEAVCAELGSEAAGEVLWVVLAV